MSKDYYNILGVSPDASGDEIKKSFRAKAQDFHPDKPGGDEKKFKEANEAYNVLKDKNKRAQYDQFGSAQAGGMGGAAGGGFGGFGGFSQGGVEFDMGDIFNMFGGSGGGRRSNRGADISVDISISFAQSVFGHDASFSINKNKQCDTCSGSGARDGKTKKCTTCNGNGQVSRVQQTIMGTIQRQAVCDDCRGTGQRAEQACDDCRGSGAQQGTEEINVAIPAGIESGQQLRMPGRGEPALGGSAGDLYITVRVTPDARFEKIGDDLKTDVLVSIPDAVLGSTQAVVTVDGSVKVKIPAGTTHGTMLRVKGQGVGAVGGRRGDLYVQVTIQVPKKLSKQVKQLYQQIQDAQ